MCQSSHRPGSMRSASWAARPCTSPRARRAPQGRPRPRPSRCRWAACWAAGAGAVSHPISWKAFPAASFRASSKASWMPRRSGALAEPYQRRACCAGHRPPRCAAPLGCNEEACRSGLASVACAAVPSLPGSGRTWGGLAARAGHLHKCGEPTPAGSCRMQAGDSVVCARSGLAGLRQGCDSAARTRRAFIHAATMSARASPSGASTAAGMRPYVVLEGQ